MVRPRAHQPVAGAFNPGEAQLGQPAAHEAHAGGRSRAHFAAVSSPAPGSTSRTVPIPARSPRSCAIARTRSSRWPTRRATSTATPNVAPTSWPGHVDAANRAALARSARRSSRRSNGRARRSLRAIEGRRCAAWPEAAAGDDAVAPRRGRHDDDAGHRRGVELLGRDVVRSRMAAGFLPRIWRTGGLRLE